MSARSQTIGQKIAIIRWQLGAVSTFYHHPPKDIESKTEDNTDRDPPFVHPLMWNKQQFQANFE